MSDILTLSKLIPARTKNLYFNWCKQEFMKMSPEYRAIRGAMSNPMDTCVWCKHGFMDGEMMALAQPKGEGGNVVLCQQCAIKLLSSKQEEVSDE